MFLKMTEVNSWCALTFPPVRANLICGCRSHVTYYFLAASSYVCVGDLEKAQQLYDQIPTLFDNMRKIGG